MAYPYKSEARLNCYLTQDLFDKLDVYCKSSGVSKSAFVQMAIGNAFTEMAIKKQVFEQIHKA